MKKIIFILLALLCSIPIVKADVMPYYINSLRRYGIGFTVVKSPLVMRQTPDDNGVVLETLNFDYHGNTTCEINNTRCELDEVFAAYSESKKIAMMTTLDSSEGWSMVCFNQNETPVCGWVDEIQNQYYTWSEFFDYFGKKYGIYLFKDLQKTDKILYAAPVKQSNTTGSIEMPRTITPWLVRGNWVLVKVNDFNNQQKTGWLNYRGENGKLKLFVKL